MGKTRDRNHKRDEDYRGENRQLRKQLKHLRKELDRAIHRIAELEALGTSTPKPKINEPVKGGDDCPKCGSGMRYINLVNRQYNICSNNKCGFREVLKK
jgi:hypothetical protein